jgi:hypothetical protein
MVFFSVNGRVLATLWKLRKQYRKLQQLHIKSISQKPIKASNKTSHQGISKSSN